MPFPLTIAPRAADISTVETPLAQYSPGVTRFASNPDLFTALVTVSFPLAAIGNASLHGLFAAHVAEMDTFLKAVATLDSCKTETQQPCGPAASACFPARCTTSFAVVDPTLPDAPAVYANEAFEQLTGYSAAETIGKNLRFLQGTDQHQPGLGDLRRAIQDKRPCHTILRNYKKDGAFFWNDFLLTPILDSQGQVSLWIGVQSPVTQQNLIDMGMYAPSRHPSPRASVFPSASVGRLGEILVAQGVVTRADAMAAVQLQLDGNTQPLGEILVERFGVPEYAITQALRLQIDDARAKNCQTDLLLKTAFAVRLAQTTMEAVPEKDPSPVLLVSTHVRRRGRYVLSGPACRWFATIVASRCRRPFRHQFIRGRRISWHVLCACRSTRQRRAPGIARILL